MKPIYKGITGIIILVLCSTISTAQNVDHLNVKAHLQDSIMEIKAEFEIIPEKPLDSVYFILNPAIQIDSLNSDGLISYSQTNKLGRPFPFWILHFDKKVNAGHKVNFTYQINLNALNHLKSNWIELNTDKLWFPNRGDINNPFTYEFNLNGLPNDFTPITYSSSNIIREGDRLRILQNKDLFEVFLLAGKDMRTYDYDDKLQLIGHTSIPDSIFNSMGEKVRKSIDFLNTSFGMADPIKDFRVVLRNTNRQELGYQYNRMNLIVTGPDFNDFANLSHEIAHYWWSKANFIEEPWINESFANYSMYKVLEKFDPELLEKVLKRDRETAKSAIPLSEATLFKENAYPSYYTKGAILLLELESVIGKDKMFHLLNNLIEKKVVSTSGFLEELKSLTNLKITNDFKDSLAK